MTTDPVSLFLDHVPDDFLRATMRCLGACYSESWDQVRDDYPPEEAHDLLGHVRRAKVDYAWRMLSERFPRVTASAQRNQRSTSYYTEVVIGRVLITAASVSHPNTLPREAKYRRTLARSAQRSLFPEQQDPPGPDDLLYGIVVHGHDRREPARPAFAHVAFPDKAFTGYVGRIDLFARFPELATEIRGDGASISFGAPHLQVVPQVQVRRSGA